MSGHSKAPRPAETKRPDRVRLTITFEFTGHIAVEAGQRLARRWMLDQTGTDESSLRVVALRGDDITPARATPGQVVRRRRERLGLTQRQLAELAGITPPAVGQIETGKRRRFGPGYPAILAALKKAEARR